MFLVLMLLCYIYRISLFGAQFVICLKPRNEKNAFLILNEEKQQKDVGKQIIQRQQGYACLKNSNDNGVLEGVKISHKG